MGQNRFCWTSTSLTPLHLVAQDNPNDDIADWRIRCTINGNSFVLDRWEPVYLKVLSQEKLGAARVS